MSNKLSVREKVEKIRKRQENYIKKINLLIEETYKECEHDYKFVDGYNDHDGWSVNVEINYTTIYECLKCGHRKSRKSTGKA